jgi:hypothetical protein
VTGTFASEWLGNTSEPNALPSLTRNDLISSRSVAGIGTVHAFPFLSLSALHRIVSRVKSISSHASCRIEPSLRPDASAITNASSSLSHFARSASDSDSSELGWGIQCNLAAKRYRWQRLPFRGIQDDLAPYRGVAELVHIARCPICVRRPNLLDHRKTQIFDSSRTSRLTEGDGLRTLPQRPSTSTLRIDPRHER